MDKIVWQKHRKHPSLVYSVLICNRIVFECLHSFSFCYIDKGRYFKTIWIFAIYNMRRSAQKKRTRRICTYKVFSTFYGHSLFAFEINHVMWYLTIKHLELWKITKLPTRKLKCRFHRYYVCSHPYCTCTFFRIHAWIKFSSQ